MQVQSLGQEDPLEKEMANRYNILVWEIPWTEEPGGYAQSCLILCNTLDCSPPGSSVYGDSPGKNSGVGCHEIGRAHV